MWSSMGEVIARLDELYPERPAAQHTRSETNHVSASSDTSVAVGEVTPSHRVGFCSPPRKQEFRARTWSRPRRVADDDSSEELSPMHAGHTTASRKSVSVSTAAPASSDTSVEVEDMTIADTAMEPSSVTLPSRKQWTRLRRAVEVEANTGEEEERLQMRIAMSTLSNISVDRDDTLESSEGDRPPMTEESAADTSDLPNISTIFDTDSHDAGESNESPSIVMTSGPLKKSEIPSTWPSLDTTSNKGWVSRREVMRRRRQANRAARQQRSTRAGGDRPVSPPLRSNRQMPDLQEDIFLGDDQRGASDAVGTSSTSMTSDASMMGHGVVLELRGAVHSSAQPVGVRITKQ